MFVVKRTRHNNPQQVEQLATFKKKAQAKTYMRKNQSGLNLGWVLSVEEINNGIKIGKKRKFIKRMIEN